MHPLTWFRWPLLRRFPAVMVLVAVMVGMIVDNWLQPTLYATWLTGGLSLAATRLRPISRIPTGRGICLLMGILFLGASWHHVRCRLIPVDHIARFLDADRAQPIQLRGTVLDRPLCVNRDGASAPMTYGGSSTRFRLRAEEVRWGIRDQPVSGKVWVRVTGCLDEVTVGSRIALTGTLHAIPPPQNPGQRDYRPLAHAAGQWCSVRVPHVANLRVESQGSASPRWWLGRLRGAADEALRSRLSREAHPLASAMLLGLRDEMSPEVREAFLCTGTAHILAISGLHTGVLAGLFLFAARGRLAPFRLSLVGTMLVITLFSQMTEARPPVVRASVLVQLLCLGWMLRRSVSMINSLAWAGIAVAGWCPHAVFSVGTHLSFLAVLTLGLAVPRRWGQPPSDPLQRLVWRTRPAWWHSCRSIFWRVLQLLLASAAVWAFTLPLIAYHFHIVAPISIPLNVLLTLPLSGALLSGVLLLGTHGWIEWIAVPSACLCESCLRLLLAVTACGARVPGGHVWVAGPSVSAVVWFYGWMGVAVVFAATARVRWVLMIVGGIGFGVLWLGRFYEDAGDRDSLRVAVLAVGHGNCVVIRPPGGEETWVYDAGRIGSPQLAVDWVARFLWRHGVTHLDRLVISHVDLDHYSLVPGLIRRFSVGEVGMTGFAQRESQSALSALLHEFHTHRIPWHPVRTGMSWESGGCRVSVLHPGQWWPEASDNAHSIVLLIEFAHRRLLLTGDLEDVGLRTVMGQPLPRIDVAMLPHHGSLRSQPREFSTWTQSSLFIVSGGDRDAVTALEQELGMVDARLFSTARDGAVELQVAADGRITVHSFCDQSHVDVPPGSHRASIPPTPPDADFRHGEMGRRFAQ